MCVCVCVNIHPQPHEAGALCAQAFLTQLEALGFELTRRRRYRRSMQGDLERILNDTEAGNCESPSGNFLQFANLKMVIEIVDFPIEHGGSFHSYVKVYQRVCYLCNWGNSSGICCKPTGCVLGVPTNHSDIMNYFMGTPTTMGIFQRRDQPDW